MKKILVIMLLLIGANVNAQKMYKIIETDVTSQKKPNWVKKDKTQMTISITDDEFTLGSSGESFSYQIVKKVDDKSFTISDGLNEYIITIGAGFINQELEEGVLTYRF